MCGSCERPLHEECTSPLLPPLNTYCIFCEECQREPYLQGAIIQVRHVMCVALKSSLLPLRENSGP